MDRRTAVRIGVMAVTLMLGSVGGASAQNQNRQRDVITREEILASAQANMDLEKAIRSIRPHFLRRPAGVRSMAGGGPAAIELYVDGIRQAELGSLVLIQAADVEEVRYLEPARAQEQYGITHSGGVIQVKRYKGNGGTPPA